MQGFDKQNGLSFLLTLLLITLVPLLSSQCGGSSTGPDNTNDSTGTDTLLQPLVDSDRDRIPDIVEVLLGTDTLDPYDAPVVVMPHQWRNDPDRERIVNYDYSSDSLYSTRTSIPSAFAAGLVLTEHVPVVQLADTSDTTAPDLALLTDHALLGKLFVITADVDPALANQRFLFSFPLPNEFPSGLTRNDLAVQQFQSNAWVGLTLGILSSEFIYVYLDSFGTFVMSYDTTAIP